MTATPDIAVDVRADEPVPIESGEMDVLRPDRDVAGIVTADGEAAFCAAFRAAVGFA
jgi:hypothetical protein